MVRGMVHEAVRAEQEPLQQARRKVPERRVSFHDRHPLPARRCSAIPRSVVIQTVRLARP